MRELVPASITAEVVTVLPLKEIAVNSEQGAQEIAAYGKGINIILLKKTQIHASYGCLVQQVSSYGLYSGCHPLKPTCDGGC